MEDDDKVSEAHLTSAAAFVEGGIQDACDDSCSICLEGFCESDPSTVTNCKHEFHLQCILEWCQRSSQCPMCWQPISLKDPTSQELLEAVERERSFRFNPTRNAAIFHHPTLGDFELQHLPVGVNDSELEERIIQHLAAAAAMGRARHIARREGQRSRSGQGRPQFLLASRHPAHPPPAPVSSSQNQRAGEQAPSVTLSSPSSPPSSPPMAPVSAVPADQLPGSPSPSFQSPNQQPNSGNYRVSPNQSPQNNQDTAGPSEFQTFSESLKSRLNTVSLRYKDSILKSTRGWKEKLFSRNTTMSDLSSDVRREVNAGIATVSSMMGRLDTRDNGASDASVSSSSENVAAAESNNSRRRSDNVGDGSLSGATDARAPFAASSGLI